MVLIMLLALILIILAVITIALVSSIGAGVIIIFGDVIVCGLVIGYIIRKLWKRRRK